MIQNLALKGLLCMIGSFMISLAVGLMYLWGIITIYATSYFRIVTKDDTIDEDFTDIVFPLTLIGQAFAMPFAARFARKTSARMNCMVAGGAMSFCLYMASYCKTFGTFALLYGFCTGLIIGIIYIIPVAHCYQFFPNKRSSVSVILVSASGIGTLIFAFIGFNMMNFDNVSAKDDTLDGFYGTEIASVFPDFLRVLSTVMLFLICGGGLLLFEFPASLKTGQVTLDTKKKKYYKDNGHSSDGNSLAALMNMEFSLERHDSDFENAQRQKNPFGSMNYEMNFISKGYDHQINAYGENQDREFWPSLNQRESEMSNHQYKPPNQYDNTNDSNKRASERNQFVNECPRTRDGPKESIFWKVFIIIVMGSFLFILGTNFGLMTSNNYKTYAKQTISDERLLVTMGAVAAVACGFSRFFWGLLLERMNPKLVYSFLCIINGFLAFTVFYIKSIEAVYFVYVVGAYICYGGHLGIFPAVTSQIFGLRYGGQIYGILFWAFPLSALIQYMLINLIPDHFEFGYWIIFMVSGGMSVLAFLLANKWLTYKPYDWSERIRQHNERKRLQAR